MRRIIFVLIAIVTCVVSYAANEPELRTLNKYYIYPHPSERVTCVGKDKEQHKLRLLWNRYNRLCENDLPNREKFVLEEIMQESLSRDLAWDYYDAALKYIQTIRRINYHEVESAAREVVDNAIGKFEPLVDYLLQTTLGGQVYDLKYIQSNKSKLKNGYNPEFYQSINNDSSEILPLFISRYISNDYECVLWHTYILSNQNYHYSSYQQSVKKSQILNLLADELGSAYPNGAYVKLCKLCDVVDYQGVAAFEKEYCDKAISLYATFELLNSQKDSLLSWGNLPKDKVQKLHSSSRLRSLLDGCRVAIRKRESFKGIEKKLASMCPDFERISSEILAKSVFMYQNANQLELATRNIPYLDVKLMRDSLHGPVMLEKHVKNVEQSCYFVDTLRFTIPEMDDGDYVMTINSCDFSKTFRVALSRLSVASAHTDQGYLFYLCDSYSGEPVTMADVAILSGKDTLSVLRDQQFAGWANLNDSLNSALSNGSSVDSEKVLDWVRLEFQTKDSKGFTKKCVHGLSLSRRAYRSDETRKNGKILTDRAAYKPGDTLRFKAICWNEASSGLRKTYENGAKVILELYDSENQKLSSKVLKLNGFGSASGAFVLPANARNGQFGLRLIDGDNWLGAAYITVDDFVLQDFDIVFFENDDIDFVGDTLSVKGVVKTFNGHPLAQPRAEYYLRLGEDVSNGELELSSDGNFEIRVNTSQYTGSDYVQCTVTVKVIDGSGKVEERSTYRALFSSFAFDVEFLDACDGRLELAQSKCNMEYRQQELTDNDTLRFVVGSQLASLSGSSVRIAYKINNRGELLQSGNVVPGDTLCVVLPRSGLYEVNFDAIAVDDNGRERMASRNFSILSVKDSDVAVEAGVDRFYRKVDAGDIAVQFSVGEGPAWVLYYVTDGRRLLDSRLLCVKDSYSIALASSSWRDSWPQSVTANLLYFKDGQSHHFTESFTRPDSLTSKMPLSIHILRDNVLPRQVCSLTISGLPRSECVVSVFDKRIESIRSNLWTSDEINRPYAYLPINIQVPSSFSSGYQSYPLYGYPYCRNAMFPNTKSDRCDLEESVEFECTLADKDEVCLRGFASEPLLVRENFARTLCFEPHLQTGDDGNVSMFFDSGDELSTFVVSVYAHNCLINNAVARGELVVSIPVKVGVNVPQYLYYGDIYNMSVTLTNSSDLAVDGNVVCEVYDAEDYRSVEPLAVFSKPMTVSGKDGVTTSFPISINDLVGSVASSSITFNNQKKSSTDSGDDCSSLIPNIYFKLSFCSDVFSDAVYVGVPLHCPEQTLTESHSLVQPSGMSDEQAYEILAGEFKGTSPHGALFSVKSVGDILSDFYCDLYPLEAFDAVSCSAGLYNLLNVKVLDYSLSGRVLSLYDLDMEIKTVVGRLLNSVNSDGGFGWVPGMKSNVYVTEFVLYRMLKLVEIGLWSGYVAESDLGGVLDRAVEYLEKCYFAEGVSFLGNDCGYVSDVSVLKRCSNSFFLLRSALGIFSPWTGVKYHNYSIDKDIRKGIISGLTNLSSLDGDIVGKLNNVAIILNLLKNDCAYADVCGFSSLDCKRLKKVLIRNIQSLVDYADVTLYGGYYYPNVLLPYRGLFASEAFVHSEAINVFDDVLAICRDDNAFSDLSELIATSDIERVRDGIYLWMLMQKESQYWVNDPACFEAMTTLLSAPEHVANTKIAVLTKTYSKPFSSIGKASAGMDLSVKYYRSVSDSEFFDKGASSNDGSFNCLDNSGQFVELRYGDRLAVGEKLIACYCLETETSRSFVKMTAPRPSCLRPVNQLSGWDFSSGWFFRSGKADYSFFKDLSRENHCPDLRILYRSCYRDVKSDKTIFWFDSLPEGKITLIEEMVVTQEGVFQSAAAEIVCDYATNYCANTAAPFSFIIN